jgi:hypothetical protein
MATGAASSYRRPPACVRTLIIPRTGAAQRRAWEAAATESRTTSTLRIVAASSGGRSGSVNRPLGPRRGHQRRSSTMKATGSLTGGPVGPRITGPPVTGPGKRAATVVTMPVDSRLGRRTVAGGGVAGLGAIKLARAMSGTSPTPRHAPVVPISRHAARHGAGKRA